MCIAHTDRGTLQTLHRHSAGALVVVNSVLSGQKRRHDCLIFSQKKKKKGETETGESSQPAGR